MLRRLLFLVLLFLPLPAFAQTGIMALDGDWNGTLDTPGGRHLHMLFRFRHVDGALQAQFISVDQAGAAFPAQVKLDGRHISLAMAFGGTFDGVLAEDGKSITGSFHQTLTLPLTLIPGTILAPTVHQPGPGDLDIQTSTGTLAGTILQKGPIGVVLINGSGNANRDGNSTDNGGRNTYRAMAEALAAHDITSLRFDKRGVGESAPALRREEDVRIQTYADDVKSWAAELKRRLGARCVWLGGHSEGGELAILAAQNNPDICGLVLFASPGRDFTVVLHEQFTRQLPADLQPAAFAALDDLAAGRPVATPPPQLMGLFRPSLQPFLHSQVDVHPAALLAQLKIPVLILQGDADVQISVADAKALAAARPDATLQILPGVNHSQRLAATDTGSGPGPLAPGEMDMVAQFMHEHAK